MQPVGDILTCLRFFSRLPLPQEASGRARGVAEAVVMVPVAGGVVGLVPAAVLVAGMGLGLPPLLAATLSIAALVAATGALHEDGLADCADGFGGGQSIARKLEIMRDSRIGTFGTCALVLSLLCRAAAVGALAASSVPLGIAALLLTAILSRTACLLPLLLLPPARHDGLGTFAGRPSASRYGAAVILAAGLGFGTLPFGVAFMPLLIAIAGAFLAAEAVCLLAHRQIGGQTGDVCGAAEQAAEIAVLAILCAASGELFSSQTRL